MQQHKPATENRTSPETILASLCNRGEIYEKNMEELDKLNGLEKNGLVQDHWELKVKAFLLFLCFAVFFSQAVAYLIGEILGKTGYGFFIVSGLYLLMGLIYYLMYLRNCAQSSAVKKDKMKFYPE